MCQIVEEIDRMFKYAQEKKWYHTYWAFDIHKTIIVPDYKKDSSKMVYYDYAKETLQLMTETRPDLIKYLWTNTSPEIILKYQEQFKENGIVFKYANENPEITNENHFGCYDQKPYYNILFEDKAGFNPEKDWEPVYRYMLKAPKPDFNWL